MSAPEVGAARFVGASVTRREDPRLLSGHGSFVDDLVLPGMLHVAFVRSTMARARLLAVETTAAAALDGVCAVLTGDDINDDFGGEYWFTMTGRDTVFAPFRVLARGDVRHVGEPVVMVVADSRYVAEDACELVEVEYEPLDPVLDVVAAIDDHDHLVHAELTSNVKNRVATPPDDEIDAVFASAAHVFEETIDQQRYLAVPMETRGVVAHWDPGAGELRIRAATQSAHGVRDFFARFLPLAEHRIHVTMHDVGGAFGLKMFPSREEIAVVLATRRIGRPVKWIEDRQENLAAGMNARAEQATIRMAVDDDANILAIDVRHIEDIGSYPIVGGSGTMISNVVTGPYRVARRRYSNHVVFTNTPGRGAYRGPWMFETVLREMLLDVVARGMGLDPLELRRRNVLRPADLPYTMASGLVLDSISPAACLEQAVAAIDYDGFRREQAAARAAGRYLGIGIGMAVEPTASGRGALGTEGATVRVDVGGKVLLLMGTGSHGQGLETTMCQVVADALGVELDDVAFVQGDTDVTPFGPGTGGSRSGVIGGGAARAAGLRLREKVVQIAAHAMEAAPEDIEVQGGVASVRGTPTRKLSLAQIAELAYVGHAGLPPGMETGLEATARFTPDGAFTFSNAAHLCTVEVDIESGMVEILRYVVCEDCGEMINPMIVAGQIDGGIVQGIGGVLFEKMAYDDDGNPLTTTFLDYLLPTAAEVPVIEHHHVVTPSATNPGGVKGMGEGGAIVAPAALTNAVADALAPLGVRVTSPCLGPAEIFDLVAAAAGPT